jgi:hypothetical protein
VKYKMIDVRCTGTGTVTCATVACALNCNEALVFFRRAFVLNKETAQRLCGEQLIYQILCCRLKFEVISSLLGGTVAVSSVSKNR